MNTLQKQTWLNVIGAWFLCAAALAAGCAHSSDDSKNAVPKPAPPALTSTAPIPPVPAPPVAPLSLPQKDRTTQPYFVSIKMFHKVTVNLAGGTRKVMLTVHNSGPNIPALSLWIDGGGPFCTIPDARSTGTAHPDPVMVDTGQGWDFGPLPHGKSTQITLHLDVKKPGVQHFVIKPFAIAEDEGDTQRTIDAPIKGADRKLTVEVLVARPVS